MEAVRRDEIVDFETWSDQRDRVRPRMLDVKRARRVEIGPWVTVLFENRDTVRYQVQEMMRAERIVREADIRHELDTYNELLGGPGELGTCLLIGIDDPAARDARLRRWLDLPSRVALVLEGGARVGATWDPRQIGVDRLSAVQYLKFDVGGRVPVAIVIDSPDPELAAEVGLSAETRAALAADLAS
ncbi:MAG TPA: DUF3501 family protein [Myxococcota bacterium]|nr:DUF3501 family protein [Myxococcota bacterium]